MPKIIDSLRENLLREARVMLLKDGGRALTIRNVASACHVAVGTVYNYFKSKDELMAFVMLEDWQRGVAAMRSGAENAPDVLRGLRSIYDGLLAFENLYREAWRHYAANHDAVTQIDQRHVMVIDQLSGMVAALLTRHGALWTTYLPTFLSETLLSAAGRGEGSFEELIPILTRLIMK
ncbi:MAG: TetR/AcrR family transcriptional regulator [Clostridia bacterium]|nr:TetR/AcrR family transcriptional regulator [Clostridia bacterium]